jgi:signal transduction histidine kinase
LVWGAPQNGALFLVGVVSTYSVGRWARRPYAVLGIPVVVGWALCQLALDPLQSSLSTSWGWALWGVGAWLAGAWVRQRVELNGRQATEREASARAQLAEQRLDIARDLHDVLANSLGVIVVHAEAAEALLVSEPQRAAEAIRRVQSTGREALREVRGVLGSLREDADEEDLSLVASGPPGQQQGVALTRPDLDDVDSLVGRMQQAGLPVVCRRESDDQVPLAVSRVVYRLLQEALSNVIRHAGLVPTLARIRADNDTVTVEVTNAPSPGDGYRRTDLTFGHGLRGMEERLQALGGRLDASLSSEGGFQVRAVVPLTSPPVPRSVPVPTRDRHPQTG